MIASVRIADSSLLMTRMTTSVILLDVSSPASARKLSDGFDVLFMLSEAPAENVSFGKVGNEMWAWSTIQSRPFCIDSAFSLTRQ